MAASLAAALTSYSAAAVAKRAGAPVDLACIYLAPFVEEASKSLLGAALNAPLVAVHVLFGAYECVYDRLGRSRASPAAALSSVACHAAFGIITAAVARGVDEMLMLRLPEVAGRRLAGFLPPSTIAGIICAAARIFHGMP